MKLPNKRSLPLYTLLNLLLMPALWVPGTTYATINVGNVTVTSIGHSFIPPDSSPPPRPGFVEDFLISGVNGGATLSPVSINLDNDTQLSFTVRAPAGSKFVINVPSGATPQFIVDFGWWTGNTDSGTSLGFSASFQDLQGTAPTFMNSSAVGSNNQFFTFNSDSSTFTNVLSFSAVTFTVTYSARATGLGSINYPPYNPRNSTAEPQFLVGYQTSQATDPGRFVSISTPVQLSQLASRQTHGGGAGTFDIQWAPTDLPGVETRRGTPVPGSSPPALSYALVFKFANALASVGSTGMEAPAISCGSIDLVNSGIGVDPHEYILKFTVLANNPPTLEQCDGQYITGTLTNVNDAAGNHSDTVSGTMGLLIGDVNTSRRTDSADVAFTRSKTVSIPTDAATARFDVNLSGRIDIGDVTVVRNHTVTVLPP
jgi:hypothetical protein